MSLSLSLSVCLSLSLSLQTMGGDFKGKEQDATKGIYALAGESSTKNLCYHSNFNPSLAGDIFRLNSSTYRSQGLYISASFFEIYCSKVYDLLNDKQRLRALEDSQGRVRVSTTTTTHSPTHTFTHSLIHSLSPHSLIHSLSPHSFTHSLLIHTLTHTLTRSLPPHSLIHSLPPHSPTH